jgi:thioesterase domain-containing protein
VDPTELTAYLYQYIPLSAAMGMRILVADEEELTLWAPFGPNVNHHGTMFGGSIAALATLAAWSRAFVVLRDIVPSPDLVVASTSIEYLRPATREITATCLGGDYARLRAGMSRFGRGRVTLEATVRCEGEVVATLTGVYVASRYFAESAHSGDRMVSELGLPLHGAGVA